MSITGSIIVYVMIWWIIFFSVLPVGIQSNKEVFREKIGGMDPGAPKNPKIGKKFGPSIRFPRANNSKNFREKFEKVCPVYGFWDETK